jgi:serine/threonine protein kinase
VAKNYYDVLEVSPRARPEVIKAAYKALIGKFHPDKCGDDRASKQLNKAYQVLSNVKSREKYDKNKDDLGGTIIGDYQILEEIAEGGFGKTYKGEHITLGTPVCIKHASRISPQDEEILINEAKSIWDLRHFAIPAIRNILKLEDGSLALVMSYIPGPTLEQIIEKNKKLDAEHVCWIAERCLNALMYLHYHGVVHGDVKPQNIIVQPESHTVVLVDYGLAAIKPTSHFSSPGYTPMFASPEQIKGMPLLPESDLYSLGMTMVFGLGGDLGTKNVPAETPDMVCDFIKKLIVYDVLGRPRWDKDNLIEELQEIRRESFGRDCSFGKNIPGF